MSIQVGDGSIGGGGSGGGSALILAKRVQTTGLLSGGLITQGDLFNTVDISAGTGSIIDFSASVDNPDIFPVSWTLQDEVVITNIAVDDSTAFLFDKNGVLSQKLGSSLTTADHRNFIIVGTAGHTGGNVTGIRATPINVAYDGTQSSRDFMRDVIGPANITGNIFEGAAANNLQMKLLGGAIFFLSSNFRNDPEVPDELTIPNQDPTVTFLRALRNSGGTGHVPDGGPTTLINPGFFDDGTGTLAVVAANDWSVQQIYILPNGSVVVAYGQATFGSLTIARDALSGGNLNFTELNPLPAGALRFFLIVKGNASDLNNAAQAEFREATAFRLTGQASASGGIGGITSPGGSDTDMQFNDAGVFGGGGPTWNKTTDILGILGVVDLAHDLVVSSLGIGPDVFTNITNTAFNNVGIGQFALQNITTANGCAALGVRAGGAITTGGNHTCIGQRAGVTITASVVDNTCVGNAAGASSIGNGNTAVGARALGLKVALTGADNTALGTNAGQNADGASTKNSFIGADCAPDFITGNGNSFFGHGTALNFTDGNNNLILGHDLSLPLASISNYMTIDDIIFGQADAVEANRFARIGGSGVVVGPERLRVVGDQVTTGKMTASHYNELIIESETGTEFNMYLGDNLGVSITTAQRNIALGNFALENLTSGNDNFAAGHEALQDMFTGGGCVAIGNGALKTAKQSDNIAIGFNSQGNRANGIDNISIGNSSQFNGLVTTPSGDFNIGIGREALMGLTTGLHNIGIGHVALQNINAGLHNIAIGKGAASTLQIGDFNICIGQDALTTGSATDNFLNIGDLIFGDMDALAPRCRIGGDISLVFVTDAALEVFGDTGTNSKAFLNARHIATDETNITATEGMEYWDTTNSRKRIYDGTSWKTVTLV